jgi:hypothetical protein
MSEQSRSNVEKSNSSNNQIALVKSLDELQSIQMEDKFKNVLVTIINLVVHSGDSKPMVRHMWKSVQLHEQYYKKIQRESTN